MTEPSQPGQEWNPATSPYSASAPYGQWQSPGPAQPDPGAFDPYGQWQPQSSQPYPEPTNPYGGWEQPASGQFQPYPQAPAYGRPGIAYGAPLPEHPRATMIMVFGILSLCGVFFGLLAVFGPVALIMAVGARKELRANPGVYAEGGKITAGFVMGIIGTILLVLGIIAFILYIVLVIAVGTTSRY